MTSRDFIAAETSNVDRIILYREGLFWKAYERSAFALTSQVRPLKPTRKVLKTLDGGDLISVGFPSASEAATLGDLTILDRTDDRLTVAAPRAIDEREFAVWRTTVPVKPSLPKPKSAAVVAAASGASAAAASGPEPQLAAPAAEPRSDSSREWIRTVWRRLFGAARPADRQADAASQPVAASVSDHAARVPVEFDSSEASLRRIAQSLSDFNLADKTPMECMLFISELKNMLVKR